MTSDQRQAGKLGLISHDYARPTLVFDDFIDPSLVPVTVPSVVDWLKLVPNFPMYGNDKIGDCVWAACGHMIEAWTKYASGSTLEVPVSSLVSAYSAVTGYDPAQTQPDGSNPTDNGTMISDALTYWKKTGIAGHRILGFGLVKDPVKVKAALQIFGSLIIGVNFPQSAMDQFNSGKIFSVVPGSPSIGGHCLNVGHDGTIYQAITWARLQGIQDSWWNTYTTEVWAVLTPEWLRATGNSPSGLDTAGLWLELNRLTSGA